MEGGGLVLGVSPWGQTGLTGHLFWTGMFFIESSFSTGLGTLSSLIHLALGQSKTEVTLGAPFLVQPM